jgi:hypothetical protein
MNDLEMTKQLTRITEYKLLREKEARLRKAIDGLHLPKVRGSGPFTGNTGEARHVTGITLRLSAPRDGGEPLTVEIDAVSIPSYVLGNVIEKELFEQLGTVMQKIEKL